MSNIYQSSCVGRSYHPKFVNNQIDPLPSLRFSLVGHRCKPLAFCASAAIFLARCVRGEASSSWSQVAAEEVRKVTLICLYLKKDMLEMRVCGFFFGTNVWNKNTPSFFQEKGAFNLRSLNSPATGVGPYLVVAVLHILPRGRHLKVIVRGSRVQRLKPRADLTWVFAKNKFIASRNRYLSCSISWQRVEIPWPSLFAIAEGTFNNSAAIYPCFQLGSPVDMNE